MAELPPNSAPESPQQSSAPNGWELACVGILRSEFGRLPSRALDKTMMQLSAEQAWRENRAEGGRMTWWKQVLGAFSRPGFALAMSSSALLFAAAAWIFFATLHEQRLDNGAVVCRIADAVNAQWAGNADQLKVGDLVPAKKMLRLKSGVVQLGFVSGASAAIEGPVDFKVTDRNSMELLDGKISAEVPRLARGFAIRTPAARAVDLGTRFGIDAKSDGSTEVDVFQGRVHVVHGKNGKVQGEGWDLARGMAMVLDANGASQADFSEAYFPQVAHTVMTRPVNCGFDSPRATSIGGFPFSFGIWSGPAFALTGSMESIKPASGSGMLRFLAPPRVAGSGDSVVWQLIDLSPARAFISEFGTVDLRAWGKFNRVAGDVHTAAKFRLTIAAFHGSPAQAPALWAARDQTAVALAEKELEADNDPKTWQTIEVATSISADADFAALEIRAIAPTNSSATSDPFPGNFADTIEAEVCLPLRPGNAASTP